MEKKLTNSGPLREPADKHSIYTHHQFALANDDHQEYPINAREHPFFLSAPRC